MQQLYQHPSNLAHIHVHQVPHLFHNDLQMIQEVQVLSKAGSTKLFLEQLLIQHNIGPLVQDCDAEGSK